MNHLPYENWLFEEQTLDQEQKKSLQNHINICDQCRSLADAWPGLQLDIKQTPILAPQPGFTQRWQSTLTKKRAEKQRRLTWWIFGSSLGVALIGLGILYIPDVLSLSPGAFLANVLYFLTVFLVKTNQAREIAEILITNVPPLLSISIWILAASSLCLLCLTWVVAIWKIFIPKGVRS